MQGNIRRICLHTRRIRLLPALAAIALIPCHATALPLIVTDNAADRTSIESIDCTLTKRFVDANAERLSKLLDEIDLNHSGLEECRRLANLGDMKGALEALLAYYANSHRVLPLEPLSHEADYDTIIRAADALGGVFTEQNVRASQKRRPDGGLDWADQGAHGDKEWAWFINRHLFLRDMAETYLSTGRRTYSEAISGYISDWVLANPYPDKLTFSAQWRALEAARRITDSWAILFYSVEVNISPEARILMLSSLQDHASDLADHGSFWGGNHLLTEQSALALIAVAWPELRDSQKWLTQAREKSRHEIFAQTYPDGAYKELTNHYQKVVLDSLERLLAILRNANASDAALEERARLMWEYFADVTKPNGNGPLNNAGDLEYNRNGILEIYDNYKREDWLYIASDGARGTPPNVPPSRYFPWAGHAIMRSGWDRDAQWTFFDMGPHGSAHQHDDRLHIDISLGQYDILVDSGRYTYQPGIWKNYFTGAKAHNVVLVNSHAAITPPLTVSKPLPNISIVGNEYDFFAASEMYESDVISGTGGARHTRSIFYRRGKYWLVIDNIEAFGPTKVEALWHFHPDVIIAPEGSDIIAWANELTALRMRQIGQIPMEWSFVRGGTNPVQGWYSPDYNTKWPATTGIAMAQISKPTTFVWLLCAKDEEPPVTTVSENGAKITISVGTGENADIVELDATGRELPMIQTSNSSAK